MNQPNFCSIADGVIIRGESGFSLSNDVSITQKPSIVNWGYPICERKGIYGVLYLLSPACELQSHLEDLLLSGPRLSLVIY